MYLDTESLRRRMSKLSDDELLGVFTSRRAEYRQVAIDLASKELMRRNIALPVTVHPQPNTAAPAPSNRLEPERQSKGHAAYWLIGAVLALALIIIDEAFLQPLLHRNPTISSILKWLFMPLGIFHLYMLYKWLKGED